MALIENARLHFRFEQQSLRAFTHDKTEATFLPIGVPEGRPDGKILLSAN
jgi:hypothetical protein